MSAPRRIASVIGLPPDGAEEYARLHADVWPGVLAKLTECSIRNYSIFRHGLTLFGYFETDELEQTIDYLGRSEVNQRWSEWMEPVMKMETDPNTDFPYLLPLQWHMD